MRKKSLCELNRNQRQEIVSTLRNMIYTCPNCNIDLMIIINNNLEDNYSFKISLVAVNKTEESVREVVDTQISKNAIDFDDTCMQKLDITAETKSCIVMNESTIEKCETSLALQEDDDDCLSAYITFPDKSVLRQTSKGTGKRCQENVTLETDNNPSEFQKLETEVDTTSEPQKSSKPDASLLNSDYDDSDISIKIESVSSSENNFVDIETVNADANNVMGIESVNDVIECSLYETDEMDCKENDSAVYATETEEKPDVECSVKNENANNKRCPKIKCNLCGIRYLSQMKYNFHMERHKLNKIDKFVCTICDKEASSENLLWDHYFYTHKSSVRYVCMKCNKTFARKARLNTHQKRYKHSGCKQLYCTPDTDETSVDIQVRQKPGNCSLCRNPIADINPKAINDLVTCAACEDSALSLMVDGTQMKTITPRQYHCSQCSKHFVHKERLEFHEMRHNENMKECVCSTCGKEFRAENSLYEHYLFVHKGARPHICELCGKSFQLKMRLKEHLRMHTGEKPYQCDVCGQRSNTISSLKRHRKTHFSHSRYTCKICDKSFSKMQNMNRHLERHWKADKNVSLPHVFSCPLCTEILPTYRMLKYHMIQTHKIDDEDPLLTKQKPWYECNVCHEKFKHQMSLKAHKEKVHEGKVNLTYECDICKSTYKVKQMLINHIRIKHDGEKRYKCAQCHKGFNYTKSLYNHVLLHTGRKPFYCEYCNKSFRRKESRNRHRRKHTDKRPSEHSDFGQTVSTSNVRAKRHEEPSEDETKCSECGELCSNQQEIRMHLNKHLGEKLNKLQGV